jgi:signal transduction histidine kinase
MRKPICSHRSRWITAGLLDCVISITLLCQPTFAQTRDSSPADKIPRSLRWLSPKLNSLEQYQRDIESSLQTLPLVTPQRMFRAGYHHPLVSEIMEPMWIQVDLGAKVQIHSIALMPTMFNDNGRLQYGYGFPAELKIEASNDLRFRAPVWTVTFANEERFRTSNYPVQFPNLRIKARYVRVTCTKLAMKRPPFFWSLGELIVRSNDLNVAQGRPVCTNASSESDSYWSARYVVDGLTSLPAMQGRSPSPSFGYRTNAQGVSVTSPHAITLDLQSEHTIQAVELFPAHPIGQLNVPGWAFPSRFQIELASSADFLDSTVIYRTKTPARHATDQPLLLSAASRANFSGTEDCCIEFQPKLTRPIKSVDARYVRITTTEPDIRLPLKTIAFSEIRVFADGKNIAPNATIAVSQPSDETNAQGWGPQYLIDNHDSRNNLLTLTLWLEQVELRRLAEADLALTRLSLQEAVATWVNRIVSLIATMLTLMLVTAITHTWLQRRRYHRETAELRQQIANDLHDDIGSNLGAIKLLSDSILLRADLPNEIQEDVHEIKLTVDETSDAMREILWLIQPASVTLSELIVQLRLTAVRMLHGIEVEFTDPPTNAKGALSLAWRRAVFLSFKEVLHNIIKHSQASRVIIDLRIESKSFKMQICDNGKGLQSMQTIHRRKHFGIDSLRKRAAIFGGDASITSEEGVKVSMVFPLTGSTTNAD